MKCRKQKTELNGFLFLFLFLFCDLFHIATIVAGSLLHFDDQGKTIE